MTVFGVIWFLSYVFFLGIFPAIRYARYRYEIKDNYLDLMKGGVFRNRRHTIPYCRVMDIDSRQGLLLRAFKLTDVAVATRANEHVVPGLDIETAEQLCDRVNALVYLSSKDVEA